MATFSSSPAIVAESVDMKFFFFRLSDIYAWTQDFAGDPNSEGEPRVSRIKKGKPPL